MKYLLSILILLAMALASKSAVVNTPTIKVVAAFGTPIQNGARLTNILNSAVAGDTLHLTPGIFWIPTNHVTLLKPGVHWYFSPGAELRINTKGDNADVADRPVFTSTAATTNYFMGHGVITTSNRESHIFDLTHTGTKISVEAHRLHIADTNELEGATVCMIGFTGISVDMDVSQLWNENYDIIWSTVGADAKLNIKADHMYAMDTAIELGATFAPTNTPVFNIGLIERHRRSTIPGQLMILGPNVVVNAGAIVLGPAHIQVSPGENSVAGGFPAIINCPNIIKDGVSTLPVPGTEIMIKLTIGGVGFDIRSQLRLNNCTLYGPTNNSFPLIDMFGADLDLRNCNLVSRNSGGTTNLIYALDGVGDGTETIAVSGTTVNALIASPTLPVNGFLQFIYTNSFAGTNVTWNLNHHSEQFLNVTNAMLLIPTNSPGLDSGKISRLVMKNDKATNMNVAIAALGLRTMGGPLATAVSFTVTNGRTAWVECELIGTNKMLRITQQQN